MVYYYYLILNIIANKHYNITNIIKLVKVLINIYKINLYESIYLTDIIEIGGVIE